MTITQPRYAAPGLVRPDGSVEGPLGNLLRALVDAANNSGSADVAAIAARVSALESTPFHAIGANGIEVFGDSDSLNISWTGTTSNVPEGSRLYFTDARAQAAVVVQTITDADTTHSPSGDAVFDALALKANLASPPFTGTPTAPTAAPGTNTTQVATTAFVTAAVAAGGGGSGSGVSLGLALQAPTLFTLY